MRFSVYAFHFHISVCLALWGGHNIGCLCAYADALHLFGDILIRVSALVYGLRFLMHVVFFNWYLEEELLRSVSVCTVLRLGES